jgi:hypothetical protein
VSHRQWLRRNLAASDTWQTPYHDRTAYVIIEPEACLAGLGPTPAV